MVDIEPFFDAVDNKRYHYFDKKLDIKKDAISIPSMSERYVLNKAMKKKHECKPYEMGKPCKHKCNERCNKKSCKDCQEIL